MNNQKLTMQTPDLTKSKYTALTELFPMNNQKLTMQTPDLTKSKYTALTELFPGIVTETIDENGVVIRAIDPEKLEQEINTHVLSPKEERYQFTWPDKRKSVIMANAPIRAALRPCREESVDFDNTENLYIEGDNLDVLKLLRETYLNRVKMIYIDPPYNTGNDFIYEDDFSESAADYAERSGDYDEQGNRLVRNLDSNGRFHTDWLNMIYPRLRIARDLLTNDGVILINMDENEIYNLQKICNEVFGETNDVGTIIWDKRNPKGDAKGISYQHEYILAYAKNKEEFLKNNSVVRAKKNAVKILKKAEQLFSKLSLTKTLDDINKEFALWVNTQQDFSGGEKAYNKIDKNGDVYRPVSMAWPNKKKAPDDYFIPLIHPITKKPCPLPERGWRNPSATMQELLSNDLILFGKDETTQPNRKYLLKENVFENIPSLLYFGGSDVDLLNEMGIPFDTPKVVDVCKEHIQAFTKSNDIVLDFFSGSATTAHAVMQLNAEDDANRKFICVQLPEKTGNNEFPTICEIGKERIRRAGKKIKEEIENANAQLRLEEEPKKIPDIGFRVLKIDSSNVKDVYYTPEELANEQLDFLSLADNIKEGRTPEDLLFQVMLELGIPLSAKIRQEDSLLIVDYAAFEPYLIACFDEASYELITEIAKRKPHYAVFRDSSFKDDSAMVNFEQVFKTYSPDTIRRVL